MIFCNTCRLCMFACYGIRGHPLVASTFARRALREGSTSLALATGPRVYQRTKVNPEKPWGEMNRARMAVPPNLTCTAPRQISVADIVEREPVRGACLSSNSSKLGAALTHSSNTPQIGKAKGNASWTLSLGSDGPFWRF